jgi:hypothetical protein
VDAQIPGLNCSTCNVTVSATIRDVAEGRQVTCAHGHDVALHDETGRARTMTDSYDRLMQRFLDLQVSYDGAGTAARADRDTSSAKSTPAATDALLDASL